MFEFYYVGNAINYSGGSGRGDCYCETVTKLCRLMKTFHFH